MKMLACCRVAVLSRTCVSEGGKPKRFPWRSFHPFLFFFLARSDANCIHGVILSTSLYFFLSKARSVRAHALFVFR